MKMWFMHITSWWQFLNAWKAPVLLLVLPYLPLI